jgi:hypothetical protein
MKQSDAKRAELQALCMAYRRGGQSYTQIARLTGASKTMCHRLVQEALAEFRCKTESDVQEHISLQMARMDAAIAAVTAKVDQGHLGAIDRMLKIEERRARLLGLDMPAKIAPTTPDGKDEFGGGIGLSALLIEARKQKGD